jgi:glycine hydroxymethyltransferase
MGVEEMKQIADFITLAIRDFDANADKIREGVAEICKKFPLYK